MPAQVCRRQTDQQQRRAHGREKRVVASGLTLFKAVGFLEEKRAVRLNFGRFAKDVLMNGPRGGVFQGKKLAEELQPGFVDVVRKEIYLRGQVQP